MHHDDIERLGELGGVHLAVAEPDLAHFVGPVALAAGERAVELAVGGVELLRGADDLPAAIEAEVLKEGDGGVEEVGDAGAEGGDAEMENAQPFEGAGEGAEVLDGVVADDRFVVVQRLGHEGQRPVHTVFLPPCWRRTASLQRLWSCRYALARWRGESGRGWAPGTVADHGAVAADPTLRIHLRQSVVMVAAGMVAEG